MRAHPSRLEVELLRQGARRWAQKGVLPHDEADRNAGRELRRTQDSQAASSELLVYGASRQKHETKARLDETLLRLRAVDLHDLDALEARPVEARTQEASERLFVGR
jgi:hypothetical protein